MLKRTTILVLLFLNCFEGHRCSSNVRGSSESTEDSSAVVRDFQSVADVPLSAGYLKNAGEFSIKEKGDSEEFDSNAQIEHEPTDDGDDSYEPEVELPIDHKNDKSDEETDELSPEDEEEDGESDAGPESSEEHLHEISASEESNPDSFLPSELTEVNDHRVEPVADIHRIVNPNPVGLAIDHDSDKSDEETDESSHQDELESGESDAGPKSSVEHKHEDLASEKSDLDSFLQSELAEVNDDSVEPVRGFHQIVNPNPAEDEIEESDPGNDAAMSSGHQSGESKEENQETEIEDSNPEVALSQHFNAEESPHQITKHDDDIDNEENPEPNLDPAAVHEIHQVTVPKEISETETDVALEEHHESHIRSKNHIITAHGSKTAGVDSALDSRELNESSDLNEDSNSNEDSEKDDKPLLGDAASASLPVSPILNELDLYRNIEEDRPICQERMDLFILLDVSDAIRKEDFERTKHFFGYFMLTKSPRSRIGFITFSNTTEVIFPLNNNFTRHEMKEKVFKIEQSPSKEHASGFAMLDAIKEMNATLPKYRGAPRIIAIFSAFPTMDQLQEMKVCEFAAQVANFNTVVVRLGHIFRKPSNTNVTHFDLFSYEDLNSTFLRMFRSHLCTIPQMLTLNDSITTDELRNNEVRHFAYDDSGLEGTITVTFAIIKGSVTGSYYDTPRLENGNFFEINENEGNRNFTVTTVTSILKGGFKIEGSAEDIRSSYTVRALFVNSAGSIPISSDQGKYTGFRKSSAIIPRNYILLSLILQVLCNMLGF